jgi:hypothetical protein
MSERLASPLSFAPIQRQFYERPEFQAFEKALGSAAHQAIKAYVLLWDHAVGSNPREDGDFNIPSDVQLKAICRWRGSVKGLRNAIQTELNSSSNLNQWRLKCWEFDAARAVKARAESARRMARKRILDSAPSDVTRNVTPDSAECYADKDQGKGKDKESTSSRRSQQLEVEAPRADVGKAPPEAEPEVAEQPIEPTIAASPPPHDARRGPCGAREQAQYPDPMPCHTLASRGALTLVSAPTLEPLPDCHLPASEFDDLEPLDLTETIAAVCACDLKSFGAPYSLAARYQDPLRKLAGLATHRDIKLAFLKCQAKGHGQSVIGRRRHNMGLMIALLDETVAARVNAIEQSKAREFNNELRRAERHQQEQTRFAANGGYVNWFQEAKDGKMGN